MSRILKAVLFVSAFMLLLVSVFPVTAKIKTIEGETCGELGVQCEGDETGEDLVEFIRLIINAFLILVALAAAIFIVIGGVRYISSQGVEDAAASAKRIVLYAVIGLVVVGLAAAIVNFAVTAVVEN